MSTRTAETEPSAAIDAPVSRVRVTTLVVPTDRSEADGTLAWDRTTVVLVEAVAGGVTGIGWTYGPAACASLVDDTLAGVILGRDSLDVPGAWEAMVRACRNAGRPGITSMAVAAVDIALWDLKARLLALPLATLLGRVREDVVVYGSGGFTTYDDATMIEQLDGWAQSGITRMKIKIGEGWGTRTDRDLERVRKARRAIGADAELFVDANGAYSAAQAIRMAGDFEAEMVSWFEEPVSSDDLGGLRAVREAIEPDVAAGEYGYDLVYFRAMCAAGAVDCLQADVTRCAGITEWLRVAAVAASMGLQVSSHCAPTLHLPVASSIPNFRHAEYFHDHVRIDDLLFDGVPKPRGGVLRADLGRAGLGVTPRAEQIAHFRTEMWERT
jgi:L-alanine-DL-glutamate epimerase-like enolase superfamily enzyme